MNIQQMLVDKRLQIKDYIDIIVLLIFLSIIEKHSNLL
jgi:hypothetical protein